MSVTSGSFLDFGMGSAGSTGRDEVGRALLGTSVGCGSRVRPREMLLAVGWGRRDLS
jgi:hypothetical protein